MVSARSPKRRVLRLWRIENPLYDNSGLAVMDIREFQQLMAKTYLDKDRERGMAPTFMWFMEEVGELATSLREETREQQAGEFADVYAWLMTLANLAGVDMQEALKKYGSGCCGCNTVPCSCVGEKP